MTEKTCRFILVVMMGIMAWRGFLHWRDSKRVNYPYLPLIVMSGYDRPWYDAMIWARENTPKNALFMTAILDNGTTDYCKSTFRSLSLRSCWCQSLAGVWGDRDSFNKREQRIQLIERKNWREIFKKEKIDYIISSEEMNWKDLCAPIYRNKKYTICKSQALALPLVLGGDMSKDEFLREYNWIKELLKKSYPSHEIKIVPDDLNIHYIPGWERLPIKWHNHIVYIRKSA